MKYIGNRSLDAEISIDFRTGKVLMDYSSNSFHDPLNSNTSMVEDERNQWLNLPKWKMHLLAIIFGQRYAWEFLVGILMGISTRLMRRKLFPEKLHYPYQNFLKNYYRLFYGTYHESFEGEMAGTILQVPVDKNIWVSYELEGDYEKYISQIHFDRRIREFHKFDNYPLFVQDGWVLTFEFEQPPQNGSCKVTYV